ncbi:MAG: hypothetical protein KDD47_09115, partial [Acidobacteria bacterium]|nr:hypothetical protein [Acidobacteriota bacterium]
AYRPSTTLEEEREAIAKLVDRAGSVGPTLAFGATEVYVLSEQPAPLPYVQLGEYFSRLVELREAGGCADLAVRVLRMQPARIVFRPEEKDPCRRAIEALLPPGGRWQEMSFPDRQAGALPWAGRRPHSQVWQVWTRGVPDAAELDEP